VNGKAEDVALLSNAAEAISLIAQSLKLGQGDNVVRVLPWLALMEDGVEVRVVPHEG